jgi:glucosamine-6-phosphate deaminase
MITTREVVATTGKQVTLQIADSPVHVGRIAAEILRREWLAKGGNPFTVGLPTGGTPIPFYGALLGLFVEREIDFRNIRTFNLDEYVDLPPWHANSYRSYMEDRLFRFVNLPKENVYFLNGMTSDWMATCKRYEESMRKWGGIDLQILGIGMNGHIAFNEPGTEPASRTRIVRLSERTLQENARLFPDPKEAPEFALTVGIQTILEARKIVLLALGSSKANAVYESLCEVPEARLPASFLQTFPGELIYVLDKAAAADLPIPPD